MNHIRFSSLTIRNAGQGQSFTAGLQEAESAPLSPTQNQGVDEFVFDPAIRTFASLHEPKSFSSLLNNSDQACSFVI